MKNVDTSNSVLFIVATRFDPKVSPSGYHSVILTRKTWNLSFISWPQNKRLRTPWTTDWMHTRQDR